MARQEHKEYDDSMYKAILSLKDVDECRRFFEDLCAMTEISSLKQRFEVAKLLHHDEVYNQIKEKTNASSATISRVNRMLNYGTGCMAEILDRIEAVDKETDQ